MFGCFETWRDHRKHSSRDRINMGNIYLEKIALNASKARGVAKKVGLIPDGNWKWALRKLRDKSGNALQGPSLEKARTNLGAMTSDSFKKLRQYQLDNPGKEVGYNVSKVGNVSGMRVGENKTLGVSRSELEQGSNSGYFGHTHPNHEDFGRVNDEKPYHVVNPSGIQIGRAHV